MPKHWKQYWHNGINMSGFFTYIKKVLSRIKADIVCYRVGVFIYVIYTVVTRLIFGATCPMVLITGLPCPGCGMTRAAVSFILLRFVAAWNYNPCIYLWLLLAIWFCFFRYLLGKKVPAVIPITIVVAIITISVYLYRMMTEFPGEAPMTYMYSNVMYRMLPWWKNFVWKVWGCFCFR